MAAAAANAGLEGAAAGGGRALLANCARGCRVRAVGGAAVLALALCLGIGATRGCNI